MFNTQTQVVERFSDFFEEWVTQLESDLQLLLEVSNSKEEEEKSTSCTDGGPKNDADYEALVAKFTAHQKAYYTAKWAAAHEDVLAFFVPVWLSPLENAYLWITGWKPATVFRLVNSIRATRVPGASLADMTEGQLKKVEELRAKIRLEEEKVDREMERQQVAMADRKMVELARLASGDKGRGVDVEAAVKSLLAGLERVVKMADCVRLKTLKGLLDLLSPAQRVDFLAATSMLQIQLRRWGKKRERTTATGRRHDESESTTPPESCAAVLQYD